MIQNELDSRKFETEEYLPISNISKIMKSVLDQKTKISREAKDLVQESVTEFICFITSEASFKCKKEKRKTGILRNNLIKSQCSGFAICHEKIRF